MLLFSLGSTRFLKVARARTQEGLIVVKVFAIHDPTLPLAAHKEKIEEIRNKLASAVNCLPFQRTLVRKYHICPLLLSVVRFATKIVEMMRVLELPVGAPHDMCNNDH